MSDIFNINGNQPQIESDNTDSKCPVCGYPIKDNTQICPNCHETIWQEFEILDSDNESEQEEESPKDKVIKKYEAQYNGIWTIIAMVMAVPLAWITYKEFSDQKWIKAVLFVLVVYIFLCNFVGYLLKDTIHSLAQRKVKKP